MKALKKSAKAAEHDELRQAFETHAEESAHQVERLQQVFEIIGKPARAKTCEAMQGLTSEMEEDLEDFGGSPAADAVLIGCAQAVEHYEIARYGMLKTWATPARPTRMPPSCWTRPSRRRSGPTSCSARSPSGSTSRAARQRPRASPPEDQITKSASS